MSNGPENLKNSWPKKLMKSNNQVHEMFFGKIPFFAFSKMAKNQFLNWEKVFKNAKNAISRKKI